MRRFPAIIGGRLRGGLVKVRASWFCVGLLLAASARAAPATKGLDLRWLAPAACPDEAAVVRSVEQQLGYPLSRAQTLVIASGVVSQPKNGIFRADVETVVNGEVRDRRFEDASCAALGDAVALVLAFLIDPDAARATAASRSEPVAAEATQPSVGTASPSPVAEPTVIAPAPRPTPPPVASTRAQASVPSPAALALPAPEHATLQPKPWLARAQIGLDTGALPSATSYLGVELGRYWGPVVIGVSGSWFLPRERALPNAAGGKFNLLALGATAGYPIWSRTVEVVPWVGMESGTVYGSGFGVTSTKQGKGLWLAATGGLAFRYRLGRGFGVQAQLGAALPLSRPMFVLDNVGSVYQADFITFRASTGLEAYF